MEHILFAPLTKVVEQADGTLEVWGRAAAQEPDPQGEVFDYEASKPFIKTWSDDFYKASGGKSLGNLRAMHNPKIAAGLLTKLDFNDGERAVDVVAKVVDAGEVQKVREGVYTGFSFGGSYGPKRQVGNLVYYAAVPTELSLADNPMIKSARFTLVKADGSEEQRGFLEKADRPEGEYGSKADAGYADPGLQEDKKPRYPLKEGGEWNEDHIRAAWNYINKEKNAALYSADDLKKIKDKIIAAWKEAIDPEGPPAAVEEANKVEAAGELKKRINDVGRMAELLYSFRCLLENVVYEAREEKDGSPVPGRLQEVFVNLVQVFKDFTAEETAELMAGVGKLLEAPLAPLALAEGGLIKAGARHTAKEMEQIQQIHDYAAALGAVCQGGMEKMATSAELEKLVKDMGERLEKVEGSFTAQGEQLAKVEGELTTTKEQLAKVETENADLKDRLAKVEAQPGAPKGALRVLGKTEDAQPLGEEKDLTQEELIKNKDTLGLIKRAHRNPQSLGPR